MIIKPPGNKLLVEIVVEEVTTSTGIILAQENFKEGEVHPHSIHQAKVVFVGRECEFVKEGDSILLEWCHIRPFQFKGDVYKIIKESDIVGICEGEPEGDTDE